MSRVLPFFDPEDPKHQKIAGYYFVCPGCRDEHRLAIPPYENTWGASWVFSGSAEFPTFMPSINSKVGPYPEDMTFADRTKKAGEYDICHSFVRRGDIQFLDDCTHKLRGRTVPLPEMKK